MTEDLHVSVPDYQAEFLKNESISPSALLQEKIDQRMVELGRDPENYVK